MVVPASSSNRTAGFDRYRELVRDDRVHSDLYTDPSVFADELGTVWSGWVYLAHESEVPHPGDYVQKALANQPVVVTRDGDGQVHVVMNRCSHLGNLLCHDPRGNSKTFRCPYHGWTFRNTGELVGVPYKAGYGPDFDRSTMRLGRPGRVDDYRGFIFASLSPDVPDLREHLGHAAEAIDRLCELSPVGEVALDRGWLRHRTYTNWKVVFENEVDGYHGNFVHRSLKMLGNWSLLDQADVTNEKAASTSRYLGNGHADIDWRPQFRKVGHPYLWLGGTEESRLADYAEALATRHGAEHTRELLIDGPPHTLIFPNLFLAELFVLVIEPVGPGESVQAQAPIQWKGAPTLNRRVMRQTAASIGPAGMIIADDSAMYERNYLGMAAREPAWLLRTRGLTREHTQPDGIEVGNVTDDTPHRGFWRHYRELLSSGRPALPGAAR